MDDPQQDSTLITSAESLANQPSLRGPRPRENLAGAVLAGTVAAAVGAVVWAVITAFTGFQIGFMAVGIGLLVGIAVRAVGHGRTVVFGAVGAVLALLGCAAGNLLAGCIIVAKQQEVGIFDVLRSLDLEMASAIMGALFSPMDLLFYGLAIYEGFKLSFTADQVLTAQPIETSIDETASD